MDYTDAIKQEAAVAKGVKFEFPVSWGMDLQSEHERYLTEELVGRPVVVMNYPKDIKAFYMRLNDDEKTVAAMDVLAPGSARSLADHNAKSGWMWTAASWSAASKSSRTGGTATCESTARCLRRIWFGFERTILYATGMRTFVT